MRPIEMIERELEAARSDLCGNLPTHDRVNRCEQLYEELMNAKSPWLITWSSKTFRTVD
jgi:hypothetical protein